MKQEQKKVGYTPGPWVALPVYHGGWIIEPKSGTGEVIAGIGVGITKEDARLIASAPELKEENESLKKLRDNLLKEIRGVIDDLGDDGIEEEYRIIYADSRLEKAIKAAKKLVKTS